MFTGRLRALHRLLSNGSPAIDEQHQAEMLAIQHSIGGFNGLAAVDRDPRTGRFKRAMNCAPKCAPDCAPQPPSAEWWMAL